MDSNNQIIIYQSEDGQTQVDVRMENETVWLTQAQMVELFQTTKQNVSLHVVMFLGRANWSKSQLSRNT